MRIAVVNTHVPFTQGGAESHAANLVAALQAHGHAAELVSIPFNWRTPWSVLDHLMAARLLDLEEVNGKTIDQVIGLRFPAYHVRHPNKVLWIIHQYRSAYDFWDHEHCDLPQQEGGRAVRDSIRSLERRLFRECKSIYANSANVAQRLRRFCGETAKPLYHPPALAQLIAPANPEPYFLCPGRHERLKRQDFVLDSLALAKTPIQLIFAGSATSTEFAASLREKAERAGLANRIQWLGYVTDQALADLYAKAQAVVYAPLDEDYGYASLEAMLARKPVLTTAAAGGVLEFVDHETGWTTPDDPAAFATALDDAWANPKECAKRGGHGFERYRRANISWENVVATLLGK